MPLGKKAVGSKWHYKVKHKPDGTVDKYNARFVIRGFSQIKGNDYKNTFSPVAKLPTVRLSIALATMHHWPLHQLDVNNAFLHGFLDEEIYIVPPKGYEVSTREGLQATKVLVWLEASFSTVEP